MPSANRVVHEQLSLRVREVDLQIASVRREGVDAPIVFLHGFGTSKEDYLGITELHDFAGHAFLAYDAPGSGATECADLAAIDLPFLVDTIRAVLDKAGFGRYHLVGDSTGALTALLLAHQEPGRVLSFVNIKGILGPEDCMLSRQALTYPDPGDFFLRFTEHSHHTRGDAVPGLFRSVVELADRGDLLSKFLALPCPRMYLYGAQNAAITYLPRLNENGVELAEIPQSGHQPMSSNPVATWRQIAEFYARQLIPVARRW